MAETLLLPPNKIETSASKGKSVAGYVDWYKDTINRPLVLITRSGPVLFDSDEIDLAKRERALRAYLSDDHTGNYYWGRTILSEINTCQAMNLLFAKPLGQEGLNLILVPTSIDDSYDDGYYYQKGADIALVRTRSTRHGDLFEPICGIDVTVGNGDTLAPKQEKVGLQMAASMPVLILSMRDLVFGNKRKFTYRQYLDQFARQTVIGSDRTDIFQGLTEKDINRWRKYLIGRLFESLRGCKQTIQTKKAHRLITENQQQHILGKLQYVNELVESILLSDP